ncbi:MAG: hypothetical protein J6112_00975 [Clostridia bacterium]|nr:hypothetical protein [Clostridia bacterium]MCR5695321.1 hypothetical protein [Clostridia bacterium]
MIYSEKPHLYVFTGHFGSGKTEVAVNFAIDLKKQKPDAKVALIDMDIINPFFRSADARDTLESFGIRVETMLYANTNVDVPALTGRMGSVISDKDTYVILDVGGDDLGAKACGYYASDIAARDHTIFFVLNPYRPFTKEISDTLKIFGEIEEATLLRIDAVADNSNLLEYTDAGCVAKGGSKAEAFACTIGRPVAMRSVMSKNKEALAAAKALYRGEELLVLDEHVKLLFSRDYN